MIKRYNTLRYIVEQSDSTISNHVKELKDLIAAYNSAPKDEQELIGTEPNSGVGKDFWDSVEGIISDISKSKPNLNDVKNEELAKSMFDIKDIASKYPEIYDSSTIKPTLDLVTTESLPKQESPEQTTTPTGEQKPESAATGASEKKPEETYAKDYTGVSIVDFLDQSGKLSDFESRRKLAVDLKIVSKPEDYKGTSSQNTQMLNMLRGGPATSKTTASVANQKRSPTTSIQDVPKIKFGDMQFPPYVDMGGGRYVIATPEQVADPNLQLYIQNPRKGQGEYGKPNFIRVRRERGGKEIRLQSGKEGAAGSFSNLVGDIGNTLAKPFRK